MSNRQTRREVLQHTGVAGIGICIGGLATLLGCEKGSSGAGSDATNGGGREAENSGGAGKTAGLERVELLYAETDVFRSNFNDALKERRTVRVVFDKTTPKLTTDSELFQAICNARESIVNYNAFVDALHQRDTKMGREELALMFTLDSLKHVDNQPVLGRALPSGETVEPATVIMAILITAIVATAAVAAYQIHKHGPIRLGWGFATPKGHAWMQFEPAI